MVAIGSALPARAGVVASATLVALGLIAVEVLAGDGAAPAAAAPREDTLMVGQCLDLSAEVLEGTSSWLEPSSVACSEPHTFEITSIGPLPEDEDPRSLAEERCGELGVWNEVGVNRPIAGIVRSPLRIEARSFAVQLPSPTYVCGAVAVEWDRRGEVVPVVLTGAIEELAADERETLRYCSRARGVPRRPWRVPTTVSCDVAPRWEVTRWILWTAFYDEDPGRMRLRSRARDLCGEGARISLPPAGDWERGLPWTRCYVRVS